MYAAPTGPGGLDLAQMAGLFPTKTFALRIEFLFRGNVASVRVASITAEMRCPGYVRSSPDSDRRERT